MHRFSMNILGMKNMSEKLPMGMFVGYRFNDFLQNDLTTITGLAVLTVVDNIVVQMERGSPLVQESFVGQKVDKFGWVTGNQSSFADRYKSGETELFYVLYFDDDAKFMEYDLQKFSNGRNISLWYGAGKFHDVVIQYGDNFNPNDFT